jgi:hypothetical protein
MLIDKTGLPRRKASQSCGLTQVSDARRETPQKNSQRISGKGELYFWISGVKLRVSLATYWKTTAL